MRQPKRIVLKNGFRNKNINAMSIFEWQWYKDVETLNDPFIVNHENIHTVAWRETGYIFGAIIWLLLVILNIFLSRDVYWAHPWEFEAYEHQWDLHYINKVRKPYAWVKYIGKKRKRDKRGNYYYENK
jgi:hypothetical protein